jgi:small subunit ribosomal protein S18
MKNLESEKELIEEKVENNSSHEEEVKESSIEPESKPSKKAFFKPRKAKRLPVRITEKNNYFIRHNISYVDYKNTKLLSNFVNRQGQIISKTFAKLPSKLQRMVARAIKRARQMKLMPYIIVDQGNF